MDWGRPSYVFLQTLPGVFLLGWAVSEWLRLRRLRRFGDAAVMGVSQSWIPKAAALALFLLGITATAAMLAIPFAGEGIPPGNRPEIRVLLDQRSLDAAEDRLWEGVENAVEVILDQVQGADFSLLASGPPPEVLVHRTADAGGLRIMVSRLRYEWGQGSGGRLAETLARYLQTRRSDFPRARMAVITAISSEDLDRLPVMQDDGTVPVVFVQLSRESGAIRFGHRAASGQWQWSGEPGAMREVLTAEQRPPALWGGLSLIQCLALLAVLLFGVEYVCRHATRSTARKVLLPGVGLLLIVWLLPARVLGMQAQVPPSDPTKTFVSPIAPDLAIVTEVSLQNPYVGQQFSVIYRLRAQRPPAAVDIDPQQYPGFWTEVVPISQESASTARPLRGQAVVDFLLRQVIAYPIEEGAVLLPPLSIKVKRTGGVSRQPDDWDVAGLSTPVEIRSLPLPPGGDARKTMPLVGSAEGSMTWEGQDRSTIVLELQGTANLALFDPLDWIRSRPDQLSRARLVRAENIPRTIDLNGTRRLSLVQRLRWFLTFEESRTGQEVDALEVPVFSPLENSWTSLRVPGLIGPASSSTTVERQAAAKDIGAGARPGFRGTGWKLLGIGTGVAVLVGIGTLLYWLARKYRRVKDRIPDSPAVLERRLRISPRSFLDGAHKLLEKCARDMGRLDDLGAADTLLDRCWISVQRYRFNQEPLPPEARDQIFSSIRQILQQRAATGPDAPRETTPAMKDGHS